ncbi:MAG: hypothetical protein RBS95_00040 [Desulfobulbus sp.]|jgi:hypothetical protein|nr:hypothetical protein [Desulfobulbus sp.]
MEPYLQTITFAVQELPVVVRFDRAGLPMDAANRSSHPLPRLCA